MKHRLLHFQQMRYAMLLIACLMIGSTASYADLKNLEPWKHVYHRHGQCGNGENHTFPLKGLNNSGYASDCTDNGGWGQSIARNGGWDNKVMSYIAYKAVRTLPPYAKEEMYWDYCLFVNADNGTHKHVLYHSGDSVTTWDKYFHNDPGNYTEKLSEYQPYVLKEVYHQAGTFNESAVITFDNTKSGQTKAIAQWLLMVDAMNPPGSTGWTCSTLKTTGYSYVRYYPRFNGTGSKESPLQISSGADLKAFADVVNSGVEGTDKLYAVLMGDIDYTSYKDASAMIGTQSRPYKGCFDGQGHSISLALTTTAEFTGLFGRIKDATIKNVEISGTVNSGRVAASLVGEVMGNSTVTNVISSVQITGSSSSTELAGLFGCVGDGTNKMQLTLSNCAFHGAFVGDLSKANVSGLGYLRYNASANVSNCYMAISKAISSATGQNFFRKATSTTLNIDNCYYTFSIQGSTQGTLVTTEQMASGEVCWRLNGEKENGVWLQTLDVDDTPQLWGSLRVYGETGKYYNFQAPFRGAGTKLDPFQIGTIQELEELRDLINAGNYYLCAKLVANIDMANRNWEPIGRSIGQHLPFKGEFDGNGYILSNLNVNTGEDQHSGFFGVADSAVIKNLIICNANVHALQHAGVIAGRTEAATIQNCGVIGVVTLEGTDKSGITYGRNSTIHSCYTVYDGQVSADPSATVESCYTGKDVAKWHATGELTYRLNAGAPAPWKQTLDRDAYPLLRGALSVYKNASGYYNDSYTGGDEAGFIETTSSKDFRVIHHGGRLYEFVITMATQDGNGVYICPDVNICAKIDSKWTTLFILSNVNRDSLDFGQDWWGKVDIANGTLYDTRTYDRQVPTFWIRQGNHSTCKQTSLLWLAPETLASLSSSFKMEGVKSESKLSITSKVEATAMDNNSGFSVVEPMVALDSPEPGASRVVVTGSNTFYGYSVWDATINTFLVMEETPDGANNINTILPQIEGTHQLVALFYTRYVAYDTYGHADTTFTNFAVPFVEKPSHTIYRDNIDHRVGYNTSNMLEWAIAFPNDSDILDSDQFSVGRSYYSDMSEMKTLGSMPMTSFLTTTTDNDTTLGWFTYADSSNDAGTSPVKTADTVSAFDTWNISAAAKAQLCVYRYPARYAYYKVWRSVYGGVWSKSDLFARQWKVLLTDVLPTVDTVRIIEDPLYEQNHKVRVRIVLNNPYPWEVVAAADRETVYQEAQRHNFNRRIFRWDTNANIILQRFSMSSEYDQGKDVVAKEFLISGDRVQVDSLTGNYYVEYEDIASVPFVHYYYKAVVNYAQSNYPICESRNTYCWTDRPCYSEQFGTIRNLRATRGTVSNGVNLSWEADEFSGTTILLKRREYQRAYTSAQPLASWTEMDTYDGTATDEAAKAAVVNEYVLTITTRYRDKSYVQSDTTYGYASFYGTLDGRVKMPNGVNMPGDVHVMVKTDSPFVLNEVQHPTTGEVILPAFRQDSMNCRLSTDNKGSYAMDSVPYYGAGRTYAVYATCEGATFVSPTGSSSVINLTYEDANHEYTGIDFTCNDTRHFSGRILYTNSTVPVGGVCFLVNGTVLNDANGEPVVSDAMGNFSFVVPRMQVTIRAYKEGHTMSNDGYILGGDDGKQIAFVPTHDYDGLVIGDDTRVRLVGRVAGGMLQGAKPLGFGYGTNLLGDSITLVLQLDGNNTSYLYFNQKNPDKTTYETSYTQRVTTETEEEERIPTKVSYEAKRIVVKADNLTGEFCLDLFPTKYKITQIYANGYSTLYGAGEGMAVLDLSDSVGLHTHTIGTDTTLYDASFCRVYHAPVQVDLLQLQNGRYQALYGEQNLEVGMLSGTQRMQLAWMDADNTAQYAFTYPVYKGLRQYSFMVQAYEPYYYNNDPLGAYTRVPMAGYEVEINNGLNVGAEDEEDEDVLTLNTAGAAFFTIVPNNTAFSLIGEDALRHLSVSVDIHGYHYESTPIAAYVTGDRTMGAEVVTSVETSPRILDYIRDPYGEESYAYRAAGTTYNWARHYEEQKTWSINIGADLGVALLSSFGFGVATQTEYEVFATGEVDITLSNDLVYKDGEFSLTLNDQLSTSDNPMDQGAMADVYLGAVSTADVIKYQSFNVIDEATYEAILPTIESGVSFLVAEGENAAGEPYYLVVSGGLSWTPGKERVFAYSQEHIMNVVIPNLETHRDEALRMASNHEEAAAMAAQSGRTFYFINKDGEYEPVYPSSMQVKVDSVALMEARIMDWQDIIAENERQKCEVMDKKADMSYSLANTTLEHTEEASTYYRVTTANGPKPVTFSFGLSQDQGTVNGSEDSTANKFKGAGFRFNISVGANHNVETSDSYENYISSTGGSGFVITAIDNNYYDMDIYYQTDETILKISDEFKTDINNYEGGSGVDDYVVTNDPVRMTDDNTMVHNYVFVMRGGATRQPWIDADSTFYYLPNGSRRPLGTRSLKIDNPKIYVENPVIYNLPQDEKAVFTLHLSNETEMNGNVEGIISSVFLHVTEDSNPYGAKLSIDGQPLHNNMEFFLNPGESITKTLEVERGGKPYDYEDITLELSDEVYMMSDAATISVHYLPTSTPVSLTLPAQNFLINTLSQKDEEGRYYIPVQIEGFSTTKYDLFDHIELQYKRQTDGEDQWVNLCSYYTSDSLYRRATGTKQMITTEGKIADIRFYGEQDPVEQKYQLRAVSFCRLGNGYTTRASEVITGTKDTRCPEVFGLPKPADGILDFDDVISLPFTEPIAYNYLDATANFSVQGYTNNSDMDNSVSLHFPGSLSQRAVSSVDRVLNLMDFSIEMNIQPEAGGADSMGLMTINDDFSGNAEKTFAFAYNLTRDEFVTWMNGAQIFSKPIKATTGIDVTAAMTHVGMTYTVADSLVHFYVGEQEVEVKDEHRSVRSVCHANGVVNVGMRFHGKMNNIRLWSKALNQYEMSTKYKKQLSANEANLLGYWPANEASGTVVKDMANGAHLTLTDNVSWHLPNGFSVDLDHRTMDILSTPALKYTRDSREDYTLSFYFKVDHLSGDANLFAAGSDALEEQGQGKVRIRFIDGELYFISEGNRYAFGTNNDLAGDGAWHYLAVSVNHAQNKVSLLVDGQVVNQTDADEIGGVTGSGISYGDANMHAHIDQIQMWSMALPASYIKDYYNAALSGKEKELQIYLPFEHDEMNEQGTMYTAFSPCNQVIPEGMTQMVGDTLIDASSVTPDNTVTSPVRSNTGIENLPFKWKSTDNELQITIDKTNAQINNRQLSLVVRRVEDLNGNPMQNAQMWTTYVNRNVLTWKVDDRVIALPYGQDTTITAVFNNASGRKLGYTIDCTAPFISISPQMGTVAPMDEQSVSITIDKGLAPGIYQAMVNLTDEDDLCSTLTLSIRVVAESPDWTSTTDPTYTQSMNLIAVVKKQVDGIWTVDMCQKDKVAAFIDNECVGVASIKVDDNNRSRLYLTIRGKSELTGQQVEFRLWDALAGQTYILSANPVVHFEAKSIIGTDQPVEMFAYEMRVQSVSLNPGWNWLSLYVNPFSDRGLNTLFSGQTSLTEGDVFRIPFGSTFATYQEDDTWESTMDNMPIQKGDIYQIYAHNAATVEVSGTIFSDTARHITLDFTHSEWAPMAYLCELSQPIRQALADFVAGSEKAPAGTVIKGYNEFAVACDDGTWMGSLEYLYPGEGYFVRRNGLRENIHLTYPAVSAAAPERRTACAATYTGPSASMMPLVAAFADGDLRDDDILLAMVGKEVVAVGRAKDSLFFMALHANQGETIQFAKVRDGEVVAVTTEGLSYQAEGMAGTVEHPYPVRFDSTAETDNALIYDILGLQYRSKDDMRGPRVFIQGKTKVLGK